MSSGTNLLNLDEAPGTGPVAGSFQLFGKVASIPGQAFRVPVSRLPPPTAQLIYGLIDIGASASNGISVTLSQGGKLVFSVNGAGGGATTQLTAPQDFEATADGTQVELDCSDVANASGYRWERATVTNNVVGAYAILARTTPSTYTNTGLAAGTYSFRVVALGSGSYTNSVPSLTARVTISGGTTQLTTPTNVRQTARSSADTADFACDTVSGATGYQWELNGGTLFTTSSPTKTFTGLVASTVPSVRVQALGSGSYSNSAYSQAVTGTAYQAFSATVDSQRVATLTPATGTVATDYEYQFRTGPSITADRQADMTQTLAPGESPTDYEYQVRS